MSPAFGKRGSSTKHEGRCELGRDERALEFYRRALGEAKGRHVNVGLVTYMEYRNETSSSLICPVLSTGMCGMAARCSPSPRLLPCFFKDAANQLPRFEGEPLIIHHRLLACHGKGKRFNP
jgi:hypothetical protein